VSTGASFSLLDVFDFPDLQREIVLYLARSGPADATTLGQTPGDLAYYFSLHRSLVPVPGKESSVFDGLDPSLTGLADYPGNGSPSLRKRLEAVKFKANEALQRFRGDDRCRLRRAVSDSRPRSPARTSGNRRPGSGAR
jgi:hypothetical protein